MSRQEEKDAELDRRIVALRKKNQALLRRYQACQCLCLCASGAGMACADPRPSCRRYRKTVGRRSRGA